MRKITIEINGARKDVSDVFIRELFQRGIISPHTRIWRNGVEMQLRDAPDLMAPPPTYSAGGGFGSESGLSGLSSSSCQPTAPPLPPLPQFDGAGAYNRTYDPDVGATPKQSNRFFIFLWITATAIVLLLLGAFMTYKAQNSPKETTAEQESIPNAEKAYEESPEDLGELTEDEFGELLAPTEGSEADGSEAESSGVEVSEQESSSSRANSARRDRGRRSERTTMVAGSADTTTVESHVEDDGSSAFEEEDDIFEPGEDDEPR